MKCIFIYVRYSDLCQRLANRAPVAPGQKRLLSCKDKSVVPGNPPHHGVSIFSWFGAQRNIAVEYALLVLCGVRARAENIIEPLVINSGIVGIEGSIQLIKDYIKIKESPMNKEL